MNSAHHRTQQANAAIWATIGVVAMSVAGAALLGLVDIAWRNPDRDGTDHLLCRGR